MAIIAMTQHIGTQAFELGRLTAERLGYRFLSSEQLYAQLAERYNVAPAQLVILDVRRPHFWERLKADTERVAGFFRAVVEGDGRRPARRRQPFGHSSVTGHGLRPASAADGPPEAPGQQGRGRREPRASGRGAAGARL